MGFISKLLFALAEAGKENDKDKFVQFSENDAVWVDPYGVDFNGYIDGMSENKEYYLATGSYRKTKNSDTDYEGYVAFTENEVLFKKPFEDAIDACFINNSGLFIFFTDNHELFVIDKNGGRIAKRKVDIWLPDKKEQYHFDDKYCYIYGDCDVGKILWFFNMSSLKSWSKKFSFADDDRVNNARVTLFGDKINIWFDNNLQLEYNFEGKSLNKAQEKLVNDTFGF